MTAKKVLLSPDNVKLFYYDEFHNEDEAKRVLDAVRTSEITVMSVERDAKGNYFLIKGFYEFAAYLKLQPNTKILFNLVKESKNEIDRLIKILKITMPLEKTSWIFKNEYIMMLIDDYDFDVSQIAQVVNQRSTKIKTYIVDRNIPIHIRKLMFEREAKSVVVNICKSTFIPKEMKQILYDRAVLPKGHALRLNTEKYNFMKGLCSNYVFPLPFLQNHSSLKSFLDNLLITNFNIDNHYNKLLRDFMPYPYGSYDGDNDYTPVQ